MNAQNARAAAIRGITNAPGWSIFTGEFRRALDSRAKQVLIAEGTNAADALGRYRGLNEALDIFFMLAENLGQVEAEPSAGLAE